MIPLLVLFYGICLILIIAESFLAGSLIFSLMLGAPYATIHDDAVRPLLVFGGLGPHDSFVDFGSGDGRILIEAVQQFGVRKAIGYERSPWPHYMSRFIAYREGLGGRISIRRENFLKIAPGTLDSATFVYLYLYPELVRALTVGPLRSLRPGTKLLVVSFPIPTHDRNFRLVRTERIAGYPAYLYERSA